MCSLDVKIPSVQSWLSNSYFIKSQHEIMNPAPEYLYSITEGGVVEIKCPITARDVAVEETLHKFVLLGRVFDACNSNILNKRHNHYFQVQGQLHISRR